jgi:hypothetical protein
MEKADITTILKTNRYSFEDKGEQISVKLCRKYYFTLNFNNDNLIDYKGYILKSYIRLKKNVSLISELNSVILSVLMLILLLFMWNYYIEKIPIFELNIFFVTLLGYCFGVTFVIIKYYMRLHKIKKTLNLS